MAVQGSYDISHFSADAELEARRLDAQIDLFWNQELALYTRLGLREGMRLLDCGCGTGYLLEKLRSAFRSLHCTGVECEAKLVEIANARVARGNLDGCAVLQQSITALDLPDESFDFVVCRLVLEHLPDPMPALKEALRVLRHGGKAIFIDNDFDLHERTWPESAALGDLYDAYRRARRSEGGDPCVGRQLPQLLKQAGFGGVDLQVLAAHNQLVGDHAFLRAEGAGIPAQLVKTGYLSAAALQQIAGQWRAMLATRDHSILRILLAAVGEKTDPAPNRDGSITSHLAADLSKAQSRVSRSAMFSSPPSLAEVTGFIQRELAQELNVPPDSIDVSESLIRLGVDSMAAMGLCGKLESTLSVTLTVADVLCDSSVQELGEKVLRQVAAGGVREETRIQRQPRAQALS